MITPAPIYNIELYVHVQLVECVLSIQNMPKLYICECMHDAS